MEEARKADALKPPCTEDVCHMRSGCTTGWGGDLRCQESARGALAGYEYNHRYKEHLKEFMDKQFHSHPFAHAEADYANNDENGFLTDEELSPSEDEATVEKDLDYARRYVHHTWCRGSC